MTLPEFSVRQAVLVNILFFVCLFGGIAAYGRIPIEYFPDVTLNEVGINTVWTGASAEELERLVTQRIEEEVATVADVAEIRSTSQADLSTILVQFDELLDETEYESAVNDVRAALDRVRDLPEDAEEPFLYEIIARAPAVALAFVDVGDVGETALREVARDAARRVADLRGVESVSERGQQEREIRVLVDRDAAARFGLTVARIAERVSRKNLNLPAGTFSGPDGEATVRARGDFETPEQILDVVVADTPQGGIVRLREVASLEEGLEKRRYASRYNGRPAQILTVMKKDDADAVEVVAGIDEWVREYRGLLPPGIELHKTLDTASFVVPRMRDLVENLATGILLVIVILWFTIGFRNSFLTSIAIPFSFLTAMILFPVLDISINATTLTGMLLVSGLLVDDAIIVLENIYRKVEEGLELRRAVVEGANEVLWPVVCAVTTTIAAFAPLLLVEGTAGKFVSILPKAVVVCLAASLLECLVILPAHYIDLGSRRRADEAPGGRFAGVRGRVDAGLDWIRSQYVLALDVVLDHKAAFGALLVGICFFAFASSQYLEVDLFPGEFDTFNVLLESPTDYDLDATEEVVIAAEEPLLGFLGSEIRDFSTIVGASEDSNYDRLTGPNLAQTFVALGAGERSRSEPQRVMEEIRQEVAAWREANPEGIVELRVQPQQDGPPVGPPVEVRVQSDDYTLNKAIASDIRSYLETVPGVTGIEDNLKLGPKEVRLSVDDERAARYGLTFRDIAAALRAANDGVVATTFRSPRLNEDIDIRVLLEERYRGDLSQLLDVELPIAAGGFVKLRDVATVEVARSYLAYRRYDQKRTVSVYAQIDDDLATAVGVNRLLQTEFADVEMRNPGVELRFGGEFAEASEAFANVFRVFPIAFLAIYMILAALFRSYLQPLVVTAAIPFGFVGIVAGVGLLGYEVSFVLFYASIGLTGVVVNDSLVMVDFVNRARREGLSLREAVRQSGARRFRPILLTTMTTVMALLPMALGLQGESRTYGPFAASISFGLFVAMAGTLFAVPLVYTALIEGQERAGAGLHRLRARLATATPPGRPP